MALTMTESIQSEMNYGGFADAIGGIATIVLAIVGLAGVHANMMVAIATIVFGAALLVQGGTVLTEYGHIIYPRETAIVPTEQFSGGGVAALFLVGAAGIVLGVLALIGIAAVELTAIAAIAFGSAFIVSSGAIWRLHVLRRASYVTRDVTDRRVWSELLAGEIASGSAGLQAFAGLAAVVLGILAVINIDAGLLTLVALLVLGTTAMLTGCALSSIVQSFMGSSVERAPRSSVIARG